MKTPIRYFLNYFQILRYKLSLDRKAQIIRYIKKNKPKRVLEIGVHNGDFAIRMFRAYGKKVPSNFQYVGIDLFSELHSEEINQNEISLWPNSKNEVEVKIKKEFPKININLLVGFSNIELEKLQNIKFDLIFIDGGHSTKTVKSDWDNSTKLINENGVIFFDDVTNVKGIKYMKFGINEVLEQISSESWKVSILTLKDFFWKDWGILMLGIARVQKKIKN